jgi:cyclopropane-fatty-acyl-phospholipid synthase
VHDDRFYERVLNEGNLGLGESYMEGWWDCAKIDEFIAHILDAKLDAQVKFNSKLIWYYFSHKFLNFQTKRKSKEVAIKHYNIGNKLYQRMLDKTMNYSCGYWKGAQNLDEAQINKMELICRKLQLKPKMRLLDIGCGWGAFSKYAAEN